MIHAYNSIIPTLWLLWLVYWMVSAVRVKRTERREDAVSRMRYMVPLILGSVLLASPHFGGDALGRRFIQPHVAIFWIAVALVAAGLAFACLARAWLGDNWSANVTVKQNHELVRSGPYRFVRHPIYTGLLLAVIGTALAIGEWRGVVAVALILFSALYKLKIEERFMLAQFGEEYRRYAENVPALVPFLRGT